MKKIVLIVFLIFAVAFSIGYDFGAAASASAGAIAGAYIGQNLAVPTLIFMKSIGLVKEDIFSPFSTAMYDAMDNGAFIGSVVGGILAKHLYLHDFDFGNMIFDFGISLSTYSLTKELFAKIDNDQFTLEIVISPLVQGISIGGVW